MKCRECGSSEDFTVLETRSYGDMTVTKRRLECACGRRWTTAEVEIEGTGRMVTDTTGSGSTTTRRPLPVVGDTRTLPVAGAKQGQPLPVAGAPPSRGTSPLPVAGGGFGGSLSESGSDPSSFRASQSPDPVTGSDQEVDRARPRRAAEPFVYPAAFEAFWGAIGSTRTKGLKSDAHKAWEKRGKPPATLLVSKWNEYLASLGDTYPKDVCRWVAARGWEEVYEAAPAVRRNGKTAGNIGVLKNWLERQESKETDT